MFSCVQRKAYRSMTSGRVSRDTVFQEIRPGVGFETGDFSLKKSWGGYYGSRTTPMFSCGISAISYHSFRYTLCHLRRTRRGTIGKKNAPRDVPPRPRLSATLHAPLFPLCLYFVSKGHHHAVGVTAVSDRLSSPNKRGFIG